MRQRLAWLMVAALAGSGWIAAGNVAAVDLGRREPTDTAQLRQVGPDEYEWSLPDGLAQEIHLDLTALGIDATAYDEFRFEMRPEGSLVFLQLLVRGLPATDDVSSWYSKFTTNVGEWTEGRFDLHQDDDGVALYLFQPRLRDEPPGRLILRASRQTLGVPGEPSWRKVRLRHPRFVRYPVAVSVSLADAVVETAGSTVACTYPLRLSNRTGRELTIETVPDSQGTLRYFAADPVGDVTLAAGETRDVPVRLSIPGNLAMQLPPLYAEPALPCIRVKGVADADVVPLMGYRRWPLWGVVPIFDPVVWTPPTMQAFLAGREAAMPGIVAWRRGVVAAADNARPYSWPMPEPPMLPRHPLSYRCPDPGCRAILQYAEPMSLHRHHCTKCGKTWEDNVDLDRAGLAHYYSRRSRATRDCALAWLLTGDDAYARQAADMLLVLAAAYPRLPVLGERSTGGWCRLGFNSLMAAYVLPGLAEAYAFLAAYPGLDPEQRRAIAAMLDEEAMRVAHHSVLYSNMTAEHFRAYGTAAIATGFWPLAGEAVYSEFGFHALVERGYSEDGIAHEAGGYHRAVFAAMDAFASFAVEQGVNLYTARWKRVYDGSLAVGGDLMAAPYETAYAVWRDPAYLAILERRRATGIGEQAALHGVAGLASARDLPVASVHMPGAGYVFLRRGNAADSYELRISYIKFFDRTEFDKFSTFFLRNGQRVETMPGRMSYGDVNSEFMYATAAHNAIVVDGADERAADGRLVAWNPDPESPVAVVATNPAAQLYEGVDQLRAVALIDNNYIVFDAVTCAAPRTVDRYQYGRGEAKISCALAPVGADFPCLPHPEFAPVEQVAAGAAGRQAVLRYKDDCTLTLVADNDMQLCRGLTHGGYRGQPMEVTFARVPATRAVAFLAAFTWGKDPAPPTLRIVRNTPESILLEVAIADRTYAIAVDRTAGTARVTR